MPVGVKVGPQVQLVVRLADADGFAQVSRLEAGLETDGGKQILNEYLTHLRENEKLWETYQSASGSFG